MKKFIDLSVPIENNSFSDPAPILTKISYLNHHQSFGQLASFFPGLTKEDLPDGEAWASGKGIKREESEVIAI